MAEREPAIEWSRQQRSDAMPIVGEIGTFAFGGRDEKDSLVVALRKQGWVSCEGQSVDQDGPRGPKDLFKAIGTSW